MLCVLTPAQKPSSQAEGEGVTKYVSVRSLVGPVAQTHRLALRFVAMANLWKFFVWPLW